MHAMTFSDWLVLNWLALIAILVSVTSPVLTYYQVRLDRPRLKVQATFYEASEYGAARIALAVINAGRRPMILRLLGGTDVEGHWGGDHLDSRNGGVRLAEHERFEKTLFKEDTILLQGEGKDIVYRTMWVEDSLGDRHVIPNSDSYIKRLW